MTELQLERRGELDLTAKLQAPDGTGVMIAPPVDETYWAYRVRLSDRQAILGFPKFFTIGIGFAVEDDWNTNLPYSASAEAIFGHIARNKGDDAISDADCIAAIRLVQQAAVEDRS